MPMSFHIDCFTSLDDLKPRQRGDHEAILAILRRTKRFSVWEHQTTLSAISDLARLGKIEYTDELGYPWQSVKVIDPLSTDQRIQP